MYCHQCIQDRKFLVQILGLGDPGQVVLVHAKKNAMQLLLKCRSHTLRHNYRPPAHLHLWKPMSNVADWIPN